MVKVICVANQKGGVGKTTTAVNLSASLAVAEKKTLLIDCDPQANATSGLGVSPEQVAKNLYQVLIGKENIAGIICPTELDYLQLVPSNQELIGAEIELVNTVSREIKLKEALSSLTNKFEYIILDCPPSLGLLTINALTAADSVLIPVQCEYYAMEGLSQLLKTIELVTRSLNSALAIEGFVLTMFDSRNNICHQVADEVREHFQDKVFATVVHRNVRLSESPSYGKPIVLYDISSKGAVNYLDLAKEIIAQARRFTKRGSN
ncbi:MAG: ParA family protein [Deltaproteobacteria bacterium]|nr:MAG: ParA family protein [Deltaproteobacteria bacterium]